MGVTSSPAAAETLPARCLERKRPDASLARFRVCRRAFCKAELIEAHDPLKGERNTHQRTAGQHHVGEQQRYFREPPRGDGEKDRKKGRADHYYLERLAAQAGVSKDEAHEPEDEGEAEQMDVRDTHQRADAHAGVELNYFLKVRVRAQYREMRIAGVVASQAALRDDGLDAAIVCFFAGAVVHPLNECEE